MCHNGEPLTAEDCLFSLRCLRESSNTSVTDHMDLENSYAVDERTFVIVMDEPYMPVIANLSFPTCVMFSQKGYEEGNGVGPIWTSVPVLIPGANGLSAAA